MKTPKPPTQLHKKKLTRLKKYEVRVGRIKKARNFGWSRERGFGEGRVWGEGGPRKAEEGRGPGDVQGRGSRAGKSREVEVHGGGSRKGSTDPRRAGFGGLGFRFFGSLVWENHKVEKNVSVSHSVRLEKIAKVEKKKL